MVRGSGGPDVRALEFVDRYGPAFGLDRDAVVVKRMSRSDDSGLDHVRLQQVVNGIPVAGGEAIVHLRGNEVVSVLAKTAPDLDRVATNPVLGAAEASHAARTLLAKHLGVDGAELSDPRLEIFNPSLLDGGGFRASRLAWFVEARTFDRREYVWVDAETGVVLLNFNQMPHSRIREVYDAESGSSLPGSLVRSEGDGNTGDTDTDLAYLYSGDTYDYYWTEHGRNSYDDAGGTLVSTVHYLPQPWGVSLRQRILERHPDGLRTRALHRPTTWWPTNSPMPSPSARPGSSTTCSPAPSMSRFRTSSARQLTRRTATAATTPRTSG